MKKVTKIKKEVKTKWIKVSKDKELSDEEKIQKIIDIPLEDVRNIIIKEKK